MGILPKLTRLLRMNASPAILVEALAYRDFLREREARTARFATTAAAGKTFTGVYHATR